MPIDSSIALGTKVPDAMQSLSGMLNVQNTMQGMQARNLQMTGQDQQNQQGAIDLQERKAMQAVIADPAHRNQDGSINYNSLLPATLQAAPTTGMKYINQIALTDQQSTQAKSAIMGLDTDKRTQFGQITNAMIGQPLDTINNALDATASQSRELGTSMPWIKQQIKNASDSGGQPAVNAMLKRISDGTQKITDQQTINTPTVAPINTGTQTYGVNIKPGVNGMPQGGVVPGTGATMQPPPTTPTMGGPNGITPGIMGPAAGAAPGQLNPTQDQIGRAQSDIAALTRELARPINPDQKFILQGEMQKAQSQLQQLTQQQTAQPQPTSGFMATGLPPGQADSIAKNNDVAHNHFTDLATGVKNSQLLEGIANNIKSYAPQAITGTEEGRLSFLNGILAQLGSPQAADLKTAGDILSKNTAMLNQNGNAGSDARQTLLQMAQPHVSMTAQAMGESADQIIGQVKATRAAYSQFLPDATNMNKSGNSDAYLQKMDAWQKVADPRVWQYESLSPPDRRAFMSKLLPADRATLIQKAGVLSDKFGLFK